MRNLARRVISVEHWAGDPSDTEGRAAFRVCGKLRESLSALTGTRGFQTLLGCALARAKNEISSLGKLEVDANGSLVIPEAFEKGTEEREAAKGGAALVGQLLELLATFIGEALTLRLVQQTWPKTALGDPESERTT